PIYFDNDGVLDIYREWRPILDSYGGDRMMVLEAWIPEHRLPLYIGDEKAHQSFNFGFLQARWGAGSTRPPAEGPLGLAHAVAPLNLGVRQARWGVETMRAALGEPLELADAVGAPTAWVLSHHDAIRNASRYGFAPEYRFGEGLGRDEVPDAELGLRRARA